MKRNNKGFSLVEIIIAAAVLVIISVPLARGIITAVNTGSKGKIQMQTTAAAQNAMEEVVALSIDDIIADDVNWIAMKENGSSLQVINNSSERQEAVLFRKDIINVDSGGNKYDLRVTLDSRTFGSENKDGANFKNTINGTSLVNIENIDYGQDAYYVEASKMEEMVLPGTATTVQQYFEEQLEQQGYDDASIATKLNNISRTIEINVENAGEDENGVMLHTVTIEYVYKLSGCTDAVMVSTENIYDGTDTKNPLRNIYLFFWAPPSVKNNIVLNNRKDVPVTLYLVKQTDVGIMGASAVNLSVLEGSDSSMNWYTNPNYKGSTSVKSNFGWPNQSSSLDTLFIKYEYGYTGLFFESDSNRDRIKTLLSCTGITDSDTKNRLYQVQIEVYEHHDQASEQFQVTNKLFTLSGTKEN